MEISGRKIGPQYPPLIIAEIGINHGGNLDVAKEMVFAAYQTGCELIKHQTHFIDDEMTQEARSIFPPNANQSIWDIVQKTALDAEQEIMLKSYVNDLGMIYISTPFSRTAADFLHKIDIPAFKIGSGECDNIPFIRHVCSFGKPVIMSTGMQSIESIRACVEILECSNIEYALLECTNLYPSPANTVSLAGIKELRHSFPNAVIGFSDHSIGPEMALASVASGACILERHFTDTRYRKGPDIVCSMDPTELKYLIDRSREIHAALYNPKQRSKEEEDIYYFTRSSVVADRDIDAGTVISEQDIWARRPGSGDIPGYDFDKVIGKTLNRSLKRNQQLRWSYLD